MPVLSFINSLKLRPTAHCDIPPYPTRERRIEDPTPKMEEAIREKYEARARATKAALGKTYASM